MSASYEYYKIFYYVARYQSINKAAKIMSNSQPNITRTIKKLENELNCRLFNRTSRGVTLTKQGEILYSYVKTAHKQLELAENVINPQNSEKYKVISIGISMGICNNIIHDLVLPPIIGFHRDNPDVHLHITNASTPELVDGTWEGIYDLALITSSHESTERLRENVLYSYTDSVFAGMGYAQALKGRKISLRELTEYPLIGLGYDTDTYKLYGNYFADHGLEMKLSIEAATMGQVRDFVIGNLGMGCASPEYVRPAIDNGKAFIVELNESLPPRNISLVRNESKTNPTAALLEGYYLNGSRGQFF